MKVVSLVINNFLNDSRVLKISRSLQKQFGEVGVLALHDEGLPLNETVQGLPVERIKLRSRSLSKHRIVQLLKYIEWLSVASYKARNADILHCNDLNTLPVGAILKLLTFARIKVVYDAHEYESNQKPYQNKLSIWFLRKSEAALIRFADAVITVSDGIAEEYARLYGIDKPALVLNCPPYQQVEKHDLLRETLGIGKDQPIFLYQGGLCPGRGVELLLEAFKGAQGAIVFMGYGPLEEMIKTYAASHPNIYFHEAVPPEILVSYTSSADFGIALIENSCLSYYYCLPNKLFEYLMAGLPVIVSNLPEMKRLVESNRVGIVIDRDTVESVRGIIAQAIRMDRDDAAIGRRNVVSHYCWEEQEKNLLAVYRDI